MRGMASEQVKEWRVDLVRHADAGDRAAWSGPDRYRPLTRRGQRQADALTGHLKPKAGTKVISSPSVRCVQTVEPLARSLHTDLAIDERCSEGESPSAVLRLIATLEGDAVLCSHGDIIGAIVFQLMEENVAPDDARFQKASTWRLTCRQGAVVNAEYLPPRK
jgi:8-oxo-dGTP diphosphatase